MGNQQETGVAGILRGHTRGTCDGEEMVQTTTRKRLAKASVVRKTVMALRVIGGSNPSPSEEF
jgi:hypothetical protein